MFAFRRRLIQIGSMKPGLAALAATAASLAIAGSAAADDATAAVGVWQSPSRGAHIQIVACDSGAICGKLLSASRPKSNPQLLGSIPAPLAIVFFVALLSQICKRL